MAKETGNSLAFMDEIRMIFNKFDQNVNGRISCDGDGVGLIDLDKFADIYVPQARLFLDVPTRSNSISAERGVIYRTCKVASRWVHIFLNCSCDWSLQRTCLICEDESPTVPQFVLSNDGEPEFDLVYVVQSCLCHVGLKLHN